MEYITSNKGGRKLAFENNISIKQKVLSNGTVWGDIMGGLCPGGFCPGGFCPRGDFVQGDFVLGGILSRGILLVISHCGSRALSENSARFDYLVIEDSMTPFPSETAQKNSSLKAKFERAC